MSAQHTSEMAARAQEHLRRAIAMIKADDSTKALEALIMANDYLEILNPVKQEKAA